jgi:hypothetical protein
MVNIVNLLIGMHMYPVTFSGYSQMTKSILLNFTCLHIGSYVTCILPLFI